ncbi:hypothetical protein MKQ68_09845 [Chitinophaga horti]|uniref:Uncharacterized protein n=1 Tax=Chitinophaga horti TaxID=2920382 RepID=A0ABY6JAR0_9BACT|nr:hypothetical protein [Chitinophaga horti]UYQ95399.1 hypothetical protein MKQ68_09845 [Chitinophaga horti]
MKYILLPVLAMSWTIVCNAQDPNLGNTNLGIGTSAPSSYFHGGTNRVLEIVNPLTAINSQSHLILSTGSTTAGSVGSVSWMVPNAPGYKGIGYMAAQIGENINGNPYGNLVFATANYQLPEVRMKIAGNGSVGVGSGEPRALFDLTKPVSESIASVLGRLPEGDASGAGTFLGVQNYSTTVLGTTSFALEHRFYGSLNSAIRFHRGGSILGGFISFATNNGSERMRIDETGNVGIGATNTSLYKLTVNGSIGTKKVKVTTMETWADFVFDQSYRLRSIPAIERYTTKRRC